MIIKTGLCISCKSDMYYCNKCGFMGCASNSCINKRFSRMGIFIVCLTCGQTGFVFWYEYMLICQFNML